MRIQQVSVFVENQPGRLESILEVLEEKKISIRALSVSDTAEFGIVRMILEDPELGLVSLRDAGFTSRMDWILSAEIPDVPGGLLKTVAKPLADAGVNLKYCYAYIEQTGGDKAMVVLKVDDIEKAEQILKAL
ncbi:MAG: amino acid-binding protein [Dehalococcoidia bacterium]|nr:MAG: amino acid-binding protein [Dehalococcoidia bacterium]UCG82335.1 MAG: amino acid-binding protein [Dehalococcoidia bacterium]